MNDTRNEERKKKRLNWGDLRKGSGEKWINRRKLINSAKSAPALDTRKLVTPFGQLSVAHISASAVTRRAGMTKGQGDTKSQVHRVDICGRPDPPKAEPGFANPGSADSLADAFCHSKTGVAAGEWRRAGLGRNPEPRLLDLTAATRS